MEINFENNLASGLSGKFSGMSHGDAGKQAMVLKPARKFGIKGLTLIRAPT